MTKPALRLLEVVFTVVYLSCRFSRRLYANTVRGRLHIAATRIRCQQSDHIVA